MAFLLDTSAYIWFVTGNPRRSSLARAYLLDAESEVYLSLVSVWEMAIKSSLNRGLELPRPFDRFIDEEIEADRFQLLDIGVAHLKRVNTLPHFHRDPFDRLLIAQALTESLPLISNDAAFDSYRVQRLW